MCAAQPQFMLTYCQNKNAFIRYFLSKWFSFVCFCFNVVVIFCVCACVCVSVFLKAKNGIIESISCWYVVVERFSKAITVPFAASNALLACVFVCVFVIVWRFPRFFFSLSWFGTSRSFPSFLLKENFVHIQLAKTSRKHNLCLAQ